MPWRPILIASPPVTVARPSTVGAGGSIPGRSEEHTSELQSLMRISSAVFCLKNKKAATQTTDFNVQADLQYYPEVITILHNLIYVRQQVCNTFNTVPRFF